MQAAPGVRIFGLCCRTPSPRRHHQYTLGGARLSGTAEAILGHARRAKVDMYRRHSCRTQKNGPLALRTHNCMLTSDSTADPRPIMKPFKHTLIYLKTSDWPLPMMSSRLVLRSRALLKQQQHGDAISQLGQGGAFASLSLQCILHKLTDALRPQPGAQPHHRAQISCIAQDKPGLLLTQLPAAAGERSARCPPVACRC